MAIRLTNSFLKKQVYEGKQVKIYDEVEQGLLVAIGVKKKTFSLFIKVDGKRRYETIGYFPELTIEEAREKARKTKKALREGLALIETMQDLADEYFRLRRSKLSANTIRKYELDWDGKFPEWHKLSPYKLTVERCRKKFSNLTEKHGPIAANNAILVPQTMIKWSIANGLLPLTFANPFTYVPRNHREPRKRFMSADEVAAYWGGIEELERQGRHWCMSIYALTFLLMTGRRKEEALGLKWSYIDHVKQIVSYPMTKTGEKVFSLSDSVLELLGRVPKVKGCEFVFSSFGRSNKPIDEHTLYKAHSDACAVAEIEGLQVHDLRRTVASHMRLAGVPIADISDTLGHSDISTTKKHYAHLDGAADRRNAEIVSELMKRRD